MPDDTTPELGAAEFPPPKYSIKFGAKPTPEQELLAGEPVTQESCNRCSARKWPVELFRTRIGNNHLRLCRYCTANLAREIIDHLTTI